MKNASIRMLFVLAAVLAFLVVCHFAAWTPPAQAGVVWYADPNDPNEPPPEPEMVAVMWLSEDPNEPNEPTPERT